MLVPLNQAYGRQFISECLDNNRNIQVFVKFVADAAGDGTASCTTYNQQQIKSINITGSICNGEYTVGNVPVQTMKLSIFSNFALPMKYPGDRFNNTKSVWGNNWIEVFFAPKANTYSFTKGEVNSLGYGYDPMIDSSLPAKWKHIVRIGVFYVTNAYFDPDGVQEIDAINSVGAFFDNEYVSTIASYPATLGSVIVDALTQIGGFNLDVNKINYAPNASTIMIQEALDGYSCREVLQMCLACCGANLKKDNTNTNAAALPPEFLGFDHYFYLSYPGNFSAEDIATNHSGNIDTAIGDYYTAGYIADIPASSILKRAKQYPQIKIGAVQYGETVSYGSGIQPGSKYNLIIQSNPIFDSLDSTQLYNALTALADAYKNFAYMPVSLDIPSCPVFEPLDYVYFHDRFGSEFYTLIMSCNLNGAYAESISSGGNSVGTNSASSKKQNTMITRAAQADQISKLNTTVTNIYSHTHFKAGDTFNAQCGMPGYCDTGSTSIVLRYQMPKRIAGTTATLNSLTGRIRHVNGGYADGVTGDWMSITGVTVTMTRNDNSNELIFTISKSDTFKRSSSATTAITANTPVFGTITPNITFS